MFLSEGEIPFEPENSSQSYGKGAAPSGIFALLSSMDLLDNSSSAIFPEFYFFHEG